MLVKIVIFVPESHGDIVRKALADAGAGRIGNYEACSFSSKGVGRFRPVKGAQPSIGKIGDLEIVVEEKIETICPRDLAKDVIEKVKKVHPYEEMAFDLFPLIEL